MKNFPLLLVLILFVVPAPACASDGITTGAERMDKYLPLIEGRRVGIVTNQTGMVKGRHLVDTLSARGIDISLIFAPEHGFRGTEAAGRHVADSHDPATGIEIVSLYGSGRKPKATDIGRCNVVVFDIQDVGLRYYTYLSTMHYVMEACAESGVPLVVLDRPNPNGMYVDGPVLDTARYRSFVGMHPIPVVHGMTLGELALMINGEGWLSGATHKDGNTSGPRVDAKHCDLTVVPCEGYTRRMRYRLPVPPSPALPNMRAVYLYPSLCYFEATDVSVGRGGGSPFQMLTYPDGTVTDLRTEPDDEAVIAGGIDLSYLIGAYREGGNSAKFLGPFFENLIGVGWVRGMITAGRSAAEIEAHWADDVKRFEQQRKPYLIYETN